MIKELYSISNKTVYFKKSFVEEFRKSAADAKLLEFKKRLIAILEEKEREEEEDFQSINKAFQVNEIFKSLTAPFRFMEKGGRVGEIGEIRTWNGKKYKKMPNKEWARVYDEETRGAKLAVAALKKKIDACTNSQELLNLILANKERFCDNLGRPLPIVQKLSEFAGAKNDKIEKLPKKKGGNGGDEPPKNKGIAAKLREQFNKNTDKYLGKSFENKATGISANFSTESQRELRSRTQNTKSNGFTLQEHFEVANQIKELFENATLEKTHDDTKHGDKDVKIERFLSKEVTLKSGKKVQACITVKHTLSKDGRTIYSIEAMDIKNALEKTRAKGQDLKGDLPDNSNIAQDNSGVNENVKKSYGAVVGELKKSLFEGLEMNDD